MSIVVDLSIADLNLKRNGNSVLDNNSSSEDAAQKNYKGFVAGVFSGIAKLTGKFRIG